MRENLALFNIQFMNKGGLQAGGYTEDLDKVVEDEKGYPQPTVWKELPPPGCSSDHAKIYQVNGSDAECCRHRSAHTCDSAGCG